MAKLESIKGVTMALLTVEPEPDDKWPMFVHHPFFEQSTMFDGEWFELFDDVERARRPYVELVMAAQNVAEILVLIRDPYKMLWFKMAAQYIDDPEEYADVLKHCWISEEWPSRDANVSVDEIVELFGGAERSLMVPDGFPETLRVYRGVNRGGSPYGMSWTIVHATALWFANRYGHDGDVYELEVPREHILAYIEDRGENEVVVDARKLRDRVRKA